MRQICQNEIDLYTESFGQGDYNDLYFPEDFEEYSSILDQVEKVRLAKERALNELWSHRDLLIHRELLKEAGPVGYNDDASKTIQPHERPETSREKVLIEDPEINFLEQFPPKAHASLLSDTLFSTNSKMARYLGPGLSGALKARKNGQQIGNFVEEVRYVMPGRRRNIFDPIPQGGKYERVPNLGAKTLRPVSADKPTPNPTWGTYGGNYENVNKNRPRNPQKVLAASRAGNELVRAGKAEIPSNPNPSKFKGFGPENGVYVPYGHVIAKLETPFNQPYKVKDAYLKRRGQVQTNLEPPDPNDPESYFPMDPKTGMPTSNLPFATQGYKPQAGDTSKNFHSLVTQWMGGMQDNPEMFNKRRLNTLAGKYGVKNGHDELGVPLEPRPVTWNRPVNWNNPANSSRRRQWVTSPTDVTKKNLQRAQQYKPYGDELARAAAYLDQQSAKYAAQGNVRMAQMLKQRADLYRKEEENPGKNKWVPARYDTHRGGNATVWDKDSQKLTGPGTVSPDEPETWEKTKKDSDQSTRISTAIRRKDLNHVYNLRPVPERTVSISPELYEQYKEIAQKAAAAQRPMGDVHWTQATESPDDRIFVENFAKYQFDVNAQDRSIRPTKATADDEGKIDPNPWYWAKLDENHRVLFTYHADKEVYDMPIYSPGVIDARRPNNPTTYGGFDAAPPGAFEARPPKSKEDTLRSLYGDDPETGRLQQKGDPSKKWAGKGWVVPMMHSIEDGIQMGLNKLEGRINKGGKAESDIASLKANSEAIGTAALQYLQFNLRNGKMFNNLDGKGVYMNTPYNKRIFKTLHAVTKQMDQWQKQNPDFAQETGIRKPMSQMSMDEVFKFLAKVNEYEFSKWFDENQDEFKNLDHLDDEAYDDYVKKMYRQSHAMFKTKIPANHVRDDLDNYTARYDKGGKEIPEKGRHGFKTLNVNPNTMYTLMRNARDFYWRFAASDMVAKVWSAYYKRGDEGKARTNADGSGSDADVGSDQNDLATGGGKLRRTSDVSDDEAQKDYLRDQGIDIWDDENDEANELANKVTSGGLGSLANRVQQQAREDSKLSAGQRRYTNLMSDFIQEKKKAAAAAQAQYKRAEQQLQANPGDINAIGSKTAAKIRLNEDEIMTQVQERLRRQFAAKGMSEAQIDQEIFKVIGDEYTKEIANRYNQQQAGMRGGLVDQLPDKGEVTRKYGEDDPRGVMEKLSSKYDVSSMPILKNIGDMIASGSNKGLSKLDQLMNSSDDPDSVEAIATYHALNYLMNNAATMDDATKQKALSMIDRLRSTGMMWDYFDAAHSILSGEAA